MPDKSKDASMIDEWEINLSGKKALHKTGLTVTLDNDAQYPGRWIARPSNAVDWVQENFGARAPLLSPLLRAAVAAFERAHTNSANTRAGY